MDNSAFHCAAATTILESIIEKRRNKKWAAKSSQITGGIIHSNKKLVHMYVCMYVAIHLHKHSWMCVCMYVCIYLIAAKWTTTISRWFEREWSRALSSAAAHSLSVFITLSLSLPLSLYRSGSSVCLLFWQQTFSLLSPVFSSSPLLLGRRGNKDRNEQRECERKSRLPELLPVFKWRISEHI